MEGLKPYIRMILILLITATLLIRLCYNPISQLRPDLKLRVTIRDGQITMFAIYTGGSPELSLGNYSDLLAKIDGIGFSRKNVTELSFVDLENTSTLLLLGQKEFSEEDIQTIARYIMLCGGSILYLVPTEITDSVKDFLRLFGLEVLGNVYDDASYYKSEETVVLNGTWDNRSKIFLDVQTIVVANASALNLTNSLELLAMFNLTKTMNVTENKSVPLVYASPLIWGGNNTTAEYKGRYLYGTNVTLGITLKFWSGSRVLILSSPHILSDNYVRLPQYDNEEFIEQVLLWLAKKLEQIEIDVIDYSPQSGIVYLDKDQFINACFNVIMKDVPYDIYQKQDLISNYYNLSLLAGLEHLGRLVHIVEPEIVNSTYDNITNTFKYVVNVTINIRELYNRSVVVFLRLVVFNDYYGFFWSKALRFEIVKHKVTFVEFHPVIIITVGMIATSIVLGLVLYPYARKYKSRIREFERKITKK